MNECVCACACVCVCVVSMYVHIAWLILHAKIFLLVFALNQKHFLALFCFVASLAARALFFFLSFFFSFSFSFLAACGPPTQQNAKSPSRHGPAAGGADHARGRPRRAGACRAPYRPVCWAPCPPPCLPWPNSGLYCRCRPHAPKHADDG